MLKKRLKILQKYVLGQSPRGFHHIAYTEWGQAGSRPPVLCVHGLVRNGRDFDHLAASLQKNRRVLCPDIAGRGQSDDLPDPGLYGYPQYGADMTALIARADSETVDWVGTSMGGILGMLLAAQQRTPIHRLILNDVGPFIPQTALKRIAAYVTLRKEFGDLDELEAYLRVIYAPYGITRDDDWKHLALHDHRILPDGKLARAYDPAIAQNLVAIDQDVDLWAVYDLIRCPVLVLRGAQSDVLSAATAAEMAQRGPRAKVVEIPAVGHAPALMDAAQIEIVERFLGDDEIP